MKRIILPTDFSDIAYNAIRYALQLFQEESCTFYLLHTYTPAVYHAEYVMHSPALMGLPDLYEADSMEQLEKLQDKIIKEFENPKHTFKTVSAFNILVDEILSTIECEKIDLVIMGTQGATGAKEIFLGTHTVHVMKKAACPVLAIPSGFEYEKPKEILFPTDYEIDYQEKQLQELLKIAEIHKSSIEVIHVASGYELTDDQTKHKQKLDSILAKTAHLFHNLPNQSVISGINNFQMKKRMNLLAMVQNKHTFLERLFIEPVIKKVAFHVNIPFLVIPHQSNS